MVAGEATNLLWKPKSSQAKTKSKPEAKTNQLDYADLEPSKKPLFSSVSVSEDTFLV